MCTALSWKHGDHYFGRNLDLEYSYQETVTITPRHYPFAFQNLPIMQNHYALIGVATISQNYPLYYDAVNEKGLCIAGLNFPEHAHYGPPQSGKYNVTSYELIPWLLGQCKTVKQVEALLKASNITNTPFSADFQPTPLHWIIADTSTSITVEAMKDGLHIHHNPIGVLTNNPPFDYHLYNLSNYMQVGSAPAVNLFAPDFEITPYSNGMGGIGLPGDFSSASRFIKVTFAKLNSVAGNSEAESVSQFFHVLNAVAMPRGCVKMPDGRQEITLYSSCCNANRGIYYYTTYNNSRICAVDLHREDLEGSTLTSYPMMHKQDLYFHNQTFGKEGSPT